MNRHELRQLLLYGVFLASFYEEEELKSQFERLLADELLYEDMGIETVADADLQFVRVRFTDFLAHLQEIDGKITTKVTDWRIDRIGKVELAAIRLAVYETFYDDEVPLKVAINEAVTLTKDFSGETAGAFVNGALARIISD